MIISLCGFMGAGKSTVGKYLANIAGYHFIDLDQYIEKKCGCTVGEFFSREGEARFRQEELASLQTILSEYVPGNKNLVLSLGGGTVTLPACAELIATQTRCIYLHCPEEELARRLKRNASKRPLLAGKPEKALKQHIESLVQQREAIYASCAHITIEAGDRDIKNVIDRILNSIPF